MITLLRNLADLTVPQNEYDHLPSPSETTPASDLARIKYYRNQLAHLENSAIDDAFFTTAWEDISEAIGRLGGEDMKKDCEELKTKVLDRTYKEIILEIKHSQDKIENFLQTNQIYNEIEDWKKKDKMFVSTRASDYVIKYLQKNTCVTLTAPAGVGKSFTARHTALVLQQEQYNIIPVYSPTEIRVYYHPGKKTVFIIDDICGNFIADHQQIENWKQLLPVINQIIADKQCKIIVCCRLQIYKDDKFNILTPFISCECNLISDDLSLTVEEKAEMVDIYIGTKGKNLQKDKRQFDFFPLLCDLFHETKDADVKDFFENPFGFYKDELEHLSRNGDEGKHKVCSLALCVLFNNRLSEKWFQGKVTDEQRQILEDTCEACRLNRGTSKGELKEALDTLDGTFIRGQNGIYSTIHDKLFDFITHYFGQKIIECLIDHGNSNLVNERFIWQKSLDDKKEHIEFIIQIPDDYLDSYLKRLVKIWSEGRMVLVMNNANMKVSAFRQQLLLYLSQLEKSQQLALSNIKDKSEPGIMPLLLTCYHGYTDMVQWILDNEAEVNHSDEERNTDQFEAWSKKYSKSRWEHRWNNHVDLCDINCFTPLYLAVVRGHSNIVQMLLLKNVNVDLCFNSGFSTFLRAQQNVNNDQLIMLLEKNPEKCILNDRCPLSVACKQGNADIVQLLLEKNPTVDTTGMTALYIACWKGYTNIVSMVLKKDPNVDLCNTDGNSPLFIASQEGHTDIVRLLLERNPNIDLCNIYGVNALYVACYYGHTTNVSLLLEKNPNVDLCNEYGCCHIHQKTNFFQLNDCNSFERSNAYSEKRYTSTTFISVLLDSLDVDSCHKYGRNPLNIAIENKENKENISSLLWNPNVDICNMNGVTALYIASYFGYSTIVSVLLEKNPDVDLCSMNGCSPLYKASQCGHTDVVMLLLKKNPNVDQQDTNGYNPLLLSSQNGFVDIVRLLLGRNPDVNLCNNNGCSPLLLASQNGFTDIVRLLLDRNPNVDLYSNEGFSPLFVASLNGFTDIVKLLLERNPSVDLCDIKGVSPLLIACHNGFINIVMLLLESNPNLDLCYIDGCSSLYIASQKGHTSVVRALLERNPNVDLGSIDGSSALLIASEKGHTGIVRMLLESNPNVNLCNHVGNSPLLKASENGHTDIVRLLLERNHHVDLCDNTGLSPLLLASQNGFVDIVRLLLESNPDVDLCNNDGCSPLLSASECGFTNIVKLLLERNPCVDLCEITGCSPLLLACLNGFTDVVRLLLEKGANLNICANNGFSPLLSASQNGHTDIMSLLLERGSNVDHCSKDGCSSLFIASQYGHADIVRLLLEQKPNIDKCNYDGHSSLLLASQNGHTDIVKLLLEGNCCVDLCNKNGCSPLLLASLNGHTDIVRLLLERNPNIDLRNNFGTTALYIACFTGHTTIVSMLLEKNPNCDLCTNDGSKKFDAEKKDVYESLIKHGSSNVKGYVKKKSIDYAFDVVAGSSPLHIACFMGWKVVVSCLLDHHANINLPKEDGTTPLFYACELGHSDIVRLLLEKGADTDICRHDGTSLLNIATENVHQSVIMMMKERKKD